MGNESWTKERAMSDPQDSEPGVVDEELETLQGGGDATPVAKENLIRLAAQDE